MDLVAFSPRFRWPLFAIGLVAGTFEQIGRTGFARPHLLQRWRLFVARLSLGLVWALWHGLVDIRQNHGVVGAARVAWLVQFAVLYRAALTAYRVRMTWMFARAESLLLLAALWVVVAVVIGAFGRPGRAGEYGGHRRG